MNLLRRKAKKKEPTTFGLGKNNHYSYFQTLWMSFFSDKLYVDVVKRWRGLGVCYLFFASFWIAIPILGGIFYSLEQSYQEVLVPALEHLPILKFNKGALSLPAQKDLQKDQMWTWYSPQDHQPVLVIDPKGAKNAYPNMSVPLLVLHDTARIQVSLKHLNIKPLSLTLILPPDIHGIVNKDFVHHVIVENIVHFISIGYSLIFSFVWGITLPMIFFVALLGQFVSIFFSVYKMTFLQSLRLSSVVILPPIVLLSLLVSFGVWHENLLLAALVLALLYFLLGARACQLDVSVKS